MAEVYEVLEIAPAGSGRWRLTCRSDETTNPKIFPLCDCPDGHSSKDAAKSCLQAKVAMDKAFPSLEKCPTCGRPM